MAYIIHQYVTLCQAGGVTNSAGLALTSVTQLMYTKGNRIDKEKLMGIEYEQRITVNFPTVEAAEEVKRQAKLNKMSPSKWILHQLEKLEILQAMLSGEAR